MFIVVGVWISPVAIGALALGVGLELRAAWWAVLLVIAACSALAVAAAVRIARSTERRGTLATARWPVQQQLRAEPVPQLSQVQPPAIEQHVHYHYHPAAGQQAPAIAEGK